MGVAYEVGTPTADAFSILLPGPTVNGVATSTQINILEGNIFNPQVGVGGSVSNNSTMGNFAIGNGTDIISQILNTRIAIGGAVASSNTMQINIFSYNIFNPQLGIGRNVSNNTSVNNVAIGNGNNNNTDLTSTGGSGLLGGMLGNGNTIQLSLFSGNIFNPQWSIGGNLSNNSTASNVSMDNGNNSTTTIGGWFGLFMRGNGNTFQLGLFVSNIFNPQYSLGGGNVSNNTATTNTAIGNGNGSTTQVPGGGVVVGTTGNGNTTQVASGSGNIYNDQWNVGSGSASTITSTSTAFGTTQQGVDTLALRSSFTDPDPSADTDPDPSSSSSNTTDSLSSTARASSSNNTVLENARTGLAPAAADATGANSPSSPSNTGGAGDTGGDTGGAGGESGGGDGGGDSGGGDD
jgi:hypothetical protein